MALCCTPRDVGMASKDEGDLLEGEAGGRRLSAGSEDALPFRPAPATAPKRAAARQRAAWFNRSRGAPSVRLAFERPAGRQRVIIKVKRVAHAGSRKGASLTRHALYVGRDGAGRDG